MAQKTSNPARGVAAGLGNVKGFPANDSSENIPPLSFLQAHFISVRHGIHPDRAKLIAELAFSNRGGR